LELSLLPLDFGPPLTVASRLLCPHSTEDKSHRLLAKPRFTARSYIEKREVGEENEEEKGMTKDEMVGWDHCHNVHEFEQALVVGDGQASLSGCSP